MPLHCGFGTASCNEHHSMLEISSNGTVWAWESSNTNADFNDSESGQNKVTTMQWWIRY